MKLSLLMACPPVPGEALKLVCAFSRAESSAQFAMLPACAPIDNFMSKFGRGAPSRQIAENSTVDRRIVVESSMSDVRRAKAILGWLLYSVRAGP